MHVVQKFWKTFAEGSMQRLYLKLTRVQTWSSVHNCWNYIGCQKHLLAWLIPHYKSTGVTRWSHYLNVYLRPKSERTLLQIVGVTKLVTRQRVFVSQIGHMHIFAALRPRTKIYKHLRVPLIRQFTWPEITLYKSLKDRTSDINFAWFLWCVLNGEQGR